MSLFHHIAAAFAYARYMPRIVPEDHEDTWTKDDTASYASFMSSPTGRKLAVLRDKHAITCALNATQASQNLDHPRCRWASGVRAQISWEKSQYSTSPAGAQSSKSEEQTGVAELLERYTP